MPRPRHVLLVDDHAEVRSVLRHVVTHLYPSATTAEAADGAEALRAVEEQHPDLIVTDYQMPRMTGLELVRTLRAQGAIMPILAISSASSVGASFLAAGADHFLHKPLAIGTLRQLLRTLLGDGADRRAMDQS
jgi:two-component system capsular synthesis sensor histidine kinase RcsC